MAADPAPLTANTGGARPASAPARVPVGEAGPWKTVRRDLAWAGLVLLAMLALSSALWLVSRGAGGGYPHSDGHLVVAAAVDRFPEGAVIYYREGDFYLVRNAAGFRAFRARSPHLGEPITWDEFRHAFVYAPHQEKWTADGELQCGPAPRNLDQFPVAVRNGEVVVDPSGILPGKPWGESIYVQMGSCWP